jgi:hypothetical protein
MLPAYDSAKLKGEVEDK